MAAMAAGEDAWLKGARTMVWREEGAVDTSEHVSLTREGSRWCCCCGALPPGCCF